MKLCPIMSFQKNNVCERGCVEQGCAFWSTKYEKCSITALAEKDIVPAVVQVETQERISY